MRIPLRQLVPLVLTQRFGRNEITNGTFDSAITGWTATGTPTTFEWSAGRAHIIGDAGSEGMIQTVTLALNARYRLTFDYEVISGQLRLAKTGMVAVTGITGSGSYIHDFIETDGTARTLNVITTGGAGEFYIDNISLRRIL
jgi:hypothetical protein